jgi:arsenate reductase (thioredoxin)
MKTVLFICEHGSAKSIVAAAHFNELARRHEMPYRAVSRGTDPDEALHPAAVAGLTRDALTVTDPPRKLAEDDWRGAARVVSFGTLDPEYADVEYNLWTVPAVSEDYDAARSAIVARLNVMIDEFQKRCL